MSTGDNVTLNRDCDAIEIPSGVLTVLKAGCGGTITQTLGGSFTLRLDDGRLVRVDGVDAGALGQPSPEKQKAPAPVEGTPVEGAGRDDVWKALTTCYDPEIPVNIVDLGLIYDCQVEPHPAGGAKVKVVMTLTAPGCGMMDVLKRDIEDKIRALPGVKEVQVEVSFDPPWDASRMSDSARLQLGMM